MQPAHHPWWTRLPANGLHMLLWQNLLRLQKEHFTKFENHTHCAVLAVIFMMGGSHNLLREGLANGSFHRCTALALPVAKRTQSSSEPHLRKFVKTSTFGRRPSGTPPRIWAIDCFSKDTCYWASRKKSRKPHTFPLHVWHLAALSAVAMVARRVNQLVATHSCTFLPSQVVCHWSDLSCHLLHCVIPSCMKSSSSWKPHTWFLGFPSVIFRSNTETTRTKL